MSCSQAFPATALLWKKLTGGALGWVGFSGKHQDGWLVGAGTLSRNAGTPEAHLIQTGGKAGQAPLAEAHRLHVLLYVFLVGALGSGLFGLTIPPGSAVEKVD